MGWVGEVINGHKILVGKQILDWPEQRGNHNSICGGQRFFFLPCPSSSGVHPRAVLWVLVFLSSSRVRRRKAGRLQCLG